MKTGRTVFGAWLGSSVCTASTIAIVTMLASGTLAQSQMTTGAPSIPLRPQALANGVASRITYQYNTEFVTIGAAGNAMWNPPPQFSDQMRGYGAVNYEYRLGRTEITTSQWVAFLNAALARPSTDRIPWITVPSFLAARNDPTYSGPGRRFQVIPGRENYGVGDISWRAAAIYCNWLHNDQQTSRVSFLNGSYDVSTFGANGNVFQDQATHNADARFWIPTFSESMKAGYYDPNKGGPGQGGYWRYQNGTNTAPVYAGPMDGGGANAGFNTTSTGVDALSIPLMSYVNTQSPWGVMDLAGATEEWTERIYTNTSSGYRERATLGSGWASSVDGFTDSLGLGVGSGYPTDEGYFNGFRIAASVPTPGVGAVIFTMLGGMVIRRRR